VQADATPDHPCTGRSGDAHLREAKKSPSRPPLSPVHPRAPLPLRSHAPHARVISARHAHRASPPSPLHPAAAALHRQRSTRGKPTSPEAPKLDAGSTPARASPHALECVAHALHQAAHDTASPARAAALRSMEAARASHSASVNGPLVIPECVFDFPRSSAARAARTSQAAFSPGADMASAVQSSGLRLLELHLQDQAERQFSGIAQAAAQAAERKRSRRDRSRARAGAGSYGENGPAALMAATAIMSPTGAMPKRACPESSDRMHSSDDSCGGDRSDERQAPAALRRSPDSAEASANKGRLPTAGGKGAVPGSGLFAKPRARDADLAAMPLGLRLGVAPTPHQLIVSGQPALASAAGSGALGAARGAGHQWQRFGSQPRLCTNMLEQLAACMACKK
jgi:hypothetical protein